MVETAYIMLGSNLGDRKAYLKAAAVRLQAIEGMELVASSAVFSSEAAEMLGENPPFLNQVVKVDCQFSPGELLRSLEKIETELGRTAKGQRLSRTIDLDILLFGSRVQKTRRLTIPHGKLHSRNFALVPLLQIDPELTDPTTGRPLAEFLTEAAADEVRLFEDHVTRNV